MLLWIMYINHVLRSCFCIGKTIPVSHSMWNVSDTLRPNSLYYMTYNFSFGHSYWTKNNINFKYSVRASNLLYSMTRWYNFCHEIGYFTVIQGNFYQGCYQLEDTNNHCYTGNKAKTKTCPVDYVSTRKLQYVLTGLYQ